MEVVREHALARIIKFDIVGFECRLSPSIDDKKNIHFSKQLVIQAFPANAYFGALL